MHEPRHWPPSERIEPYFISLAEMLNVIYVTGKKEFRSADIDLNEKIAMDSIPRNKTLNFPYREHLISSCRDFVTS